MNTKNIWIEFRNTAAQLSVDLGFAVLFSLAIVYGQPLFDRLIG